MWQVLFWSWWWMMQYKASELALKWASWSVNKSDVKAQATRIKAIEKPKLYIQFSMLRTMYLTSFTVQPLSMSVKQLIHFREFINVIYNIYAIQCFPTRVFYYQIIFPCMPITYMSDEWLLTVHMLWSISTISEHHYKQNYKYLRLNLTNTFCIDVL